MTPNDINKLRARETLKAGAIIIERLTPAVAKALAESEDNKASLTLTFTFKGVWGRNLIMSAKGSVPNATREECDAMECQDPAQMELDINGGES